MRPRGSLRYYGFIRRRNQFSAACWLGTLLLLLGLFLLSIHAENACAETLYGVVPGTNTPDRGNPRMTREGDTYYPVIPGTSTPDRGSDQRLKVEGRSVYGVIPGTDTPDRGAAKYRIGR